MPTVQKYQKYIDKANEVEKQYGIPQNTLVGLLRTESGFREDIISGKTKSSAGAIGIAQFLPNTAKEYGIDPTDPMQSIEAAGRYLSKSYNTLGNWDDAIRSYNMGVQGVKDWKAGKKKLPKETFEYLQKVKIGSQKTPIMDKIMSELDFIDRQEYIPPSLNITTDVEVLQTPIKSDNFAQEEKTTDPDIEEVEKQTAENNFIDELYKTPQQQEVQQEEVIQEQPQRSVTDIYNEVSQFIDTPMAQQGKVIEDSKGQYNHAGEITKIPSNRITMKGVNYDLLGVADTGEIRIMKPNTEHLFQGATSVTEYPILTENEKAFLKALKNGR